MPDARKALDYRVEPFDLRLFAAVLERGTITGAAEALSLSLAAASARLKGLEHVIGTPLLQRSKSGALPTAAGRALARHASRVLLELDALHVEMAGFAHGLRGTVRLLCNTAAASEFLPPLIGRFLVAHPDIDIDLQELPSDGVLDALRREVADAGIVADHVDAGGLEVQPLGADRLVALLPMTSRAGGSMAIRFASLLERPFVGLPAESGLSRFLLRQAANAGRVPHHRVRVRSLDAVAQLVAAGVGVAVMPQSAARRWGSGTTRIVPLADAWAERRLLICTSGKAAAAGGTAALVDFLAREGPRVLAQRDGEGASKSAAAGSAGAPRRTRSAR